MRPVGRTIPYAMRISGSGSFNITNSNSLEDLFHQAGGGTFITWFKEEATSALSVFPFFSPTSSAQGWWVQLDSSGTFPANRLRFGAAYSTPTSNRLYKTPVNSVTYNQWHNVCISFNSTDPATNPIVCLDGIGQTVSATGTGTVYISDDTKGWRSSSVANGNLLQTETRCIRGKSWTLAEMQDYYYRGLVASGGTAVGTWLFTDGTGLNVTDTSGNGNTMVFPAGSTWVTDLPRFCKGRTQIT